MSIRPEDIQRVKGQGFLNNKGPTASTPEF